MPPLRCPHNQLVDTGIKSPWPEAASGEHLARGSEAHCVWAHRVLSQEDKLDGAFIPRWLKQEGWLKIYEGAKIEWGLY